MVAKEAGWSDGEVASIDKQSEKTRNIQGDEGYQVIQREEEVMLKLVQGAAQGVEPIHLPVYDVFC